MLHAVAEKCIVYTNYTEMETVCSILDSMRGFIMFMTQSTCYLLIEKIMVSIAWTNADSLSIGPLGTKFSEILIKIQNSSFMKMHLKTSSAKWRAFCPGGDGLIWQAQENACTPPLEDCIACVYFSRKHDNMRHSDGRTGATNRYEGQQTKTWGRFKYTGFLNLRALKFSPVDKNPHLSMYG